MNRFVQALRRICHTYLLEEKWLIAPSLRAGNQWLDGLTRQGQAVLNVRVKTLKGMTLELAGPELARRGVTLMSDQIGVLLTGHLWPLVGDKETEYFSKLAPSFSVFQTIYSTLKTLRVAGLEAAQLCPESFEVPAKGADLILLLENYLSLLHTHRLVDYAEALRIAKAQLQKAKVERDTLSFEHILVLVPEDMEQNKLERELLATLPAEKLLILPVDQPANISASAEGKVNRATGAERDRIPSVREQTEQETDARLLRWLLTPQEAPLATQDGTARIFSAIGEANEVREVFRQCLAYGYPLDEVELLYTDTETYLPLIYEVTEQLSIEMTGQQSRFPVTFAEGIPARYARPGRALTAWISWIRDGYPQWTLVQMFQDGLLEIPEGSQDILSSSTLASLLRSVRIGQDRNRYLSQLASHIHALERRIEQGESVLDEEGELIPDWLDRSRRQLDGLRILYQIVETLLHISPEPGASATSILTSTRTFLQQFARSINELDNHTRQHFIQIITDILPWAELLEEDRNFDIWEWFTALSAQVHVLNSGPQQGHLHVASLFAGGHSGRQHTFIVGLDDGRFPGANLQDPLLLDSEREVLSPQLPTASRQIEEKFLHFTRLLCRLRGTIILGFSCWNLRDDREMFPSSVILNAYRLLSGNHEGHHRDLMCWLPAPASFAPANPAYCLDETDWWLWRLSGTEGIADPIGLVTHCFPHLGRGYHAIAQRAGTAFTTYDGFVPLAGLDLDPRTAQGTVLSARALETVGRCPLAYFFRYVLALSAPDELTIDPTRWLDSKQMGALLHAVFRQFMNELLRQNRWPPLYTRDEQHLLTILDEHITRYQLHFPPPYTSVFHQQYRELQEIVRIFLLEEERHGQNSQPAYLGVSFGVAVEDEGTPLDTSHPLSIQLPDGSQIRIRGRIDRMDYCGDLSEKRVALWDYKTGSLYKYKQIRKDPFRAGREVQHILSLKLVESRSRLSPSLAATPVQFGYFFPGRRGHGERLTWNLSQLSAGDPLLKNLCQIIANGAFLATDKHTEDCLFCEFQMICHDLEATAMASQKKLADLANEHLQPFRELRGYAR